MPNKIGDKNKTKDQLTKELAKLRQRIGELERTENERKKEVLRGSGGELRDIIDSVKDGIVLLDLTGKVTAINKSVTEAAGYADEDVVGKRFKVLKMFPPKSIATMLAAFKQVISGQQPPPYEVEVYTRTGKKLAVEIHGSLLKKGEGKAGVVAVLRDITERKQLEALLLRERETFVTILQNALYGVVLLDKDGKHVYVNPAFTGITGYTLEDIPTGKDWMHKAYPDEAYRQQVVALWKQDRGVGGTKRVISIVCKNGETKEIEFSPTVLDDGRAVVMLSDITERKRVEEALQRHREHLEELVTERTAALQATNAQLQREIIERKLMEEDLRESEERFRQFFEHEPAYCYMISPEGVIFDANNAALGVLGYKKKELVGKPLQTIYAPESLPKMEQLYSKWKKIGQLKDEEMVIITKEGERRTVLLSAGAVKDSDGKILHSISVQNDITERKNIEDALRESEERFRRVVETMEVGLGTIDENGVLTYVNEYLAKMLGYSINEMIGRSTLDFYEEESRQVQEEIFKKRRAGMRDPTPYEVTWRRKDGKKVYSILSPTPLFDANGHYMGSFAIHTDITIRKRMEETLRNSEEKYRELINGMNDTAWVIDFNGNFIDVNDAAVEVLGYSREELLSMGPHDIDDTLDAEEIRVLIKEMPTDKIQVFETTHTTKDGKVIPVEIKSSLVTYQGKRAILSIARDITKRKQMEEELRVSEERFRNLVERMKVGLSAIDEKGVLTYVNEQFCTILGYSMDEVIGRPTVDFYYDEETRKFQEKVFAKRKKGMRDPTPYEIAWRTKDGKKVYTILSPTPNFDADGRYIGSSAIQTDITERKQMEEALRQSEERFRLLVEHSVDAFILHDFDGRIIDVNQHSCDSVGYTREELLNMFVEDIDEDVIPGKHKEQWKQMVPGVPTTLEGVHRRKDGTTFPVEVRLVAFESGGRKLILSLVRDITERKQMEESLRERQQELQALMDASPTAISWADLQGNIQYINRKHHELFGYTLKDIPTIDEWQHQADQDQAQQKRFAHWPEELMEAYKQGRSLPPREMTITCKDGSIRYVTVEGAIVSNHNLVIYNDITERVRAEEVIRKLAYHDALTGLPNRVLFADRLDFAMSQAHRSQRRLAVMSLDLDRFKNVNDTFGHSVGDKLLHSVGRRLTGLLRKNDTISRTGGDEFSLLMPEIDQEKDTVTVAQKVLDVFQEPFVLDVHELHITTSIGIAIYPDDGEDADTLLKHSDIAMYQAKQKGRNNYQRYTPI